MPEHSSSSQQQRLSGRIIALWCAASALCGARLVQLGRTILWDENGVAGCRPEQVGQVRLLVDARNYSAQLFPLHEFLQGPGLLLPHMLSEGKHNNHTDTAAVCQWNTNPKHNRFSHEMEHLYSCWSYWQLHPNSTWILYRAESNHPHHTPRGRRQYQHEMRFVNGLLEALEDQVVVTSDSSVLKTAVQRRNYDDNKRQQQRSFHMASPDHARSLAATVQAALGVIPTVGNFSLQREPTIAILNRRLLAKRSIRNAESLARRIQRELLWRKDDNAVNRSKVTVVDFEDKSFREQIDFFAHHDLIISPHGGQLAGLAFLPECAAVLEVFPSPHFHNEQYFGSLVEAAGLAQYSFGVDGSAASTTFSVSKRERRIAQQAQLCPSRTAIVEGVRQMMDDWYACRRRRDEALQEDIANSQ